MRKLFGLTGLLMGLLCLPSLGLAQVKFLEITVVSAKVWPVKPDGKCWDPCFGKKYKLPARGAKDYNTYMQEAEFRKACTGSKAPDPLVEIEIGKYGKFTTGQKNNDCTPTFNVSHTFQIEAGAPFKVAVYDNDGAAGIQAKRDLMGEWAAASVPEQLMNNGTLTLRGFGQVEELVLTGKIVQKAVATTCEGTYSVKIAEVEVMATKENGKTWDKSILRKKAAMPDIIVTMTIAGQKVETPLQRDTLQATFTNVETTVAIKAGTTLSLLVEDHDGVKREKIGQTALPDVCKVIPSGGSGQYVVPTFDRVVKVVLIFTKK